MFIVVNVSCGFYNRYPLAAIKPTRNNSCLYSISYCIQRNLSVYNIVEQMLLLNAKPNWF
jgi:hypothetical protein